MKKSIKVEMLSKSNVSIVKSASFAALACYISKFPAWGKLIDVFKKLFNTGHHTTFMHAPSYFTFKIEGISVGDITFGLHLTSPFYNSSQRSGRYCSAMFIRFVKKISRTLGEYLEKTFAGYEFKDESVNQDSNVSQKLQAIRQYVTDFYPELKNADMEAVMGYVESGINVFQENIEKATVTAAMFAKQDRPFINASYIKNNAPKFAQEQMRAFIPVIVPTGIVYTVNLISLVALYESAWTPAMRYVTAEMSRLVLEKHPKLAQMFNEINRRKKDWAISAPSLGGIRVARAPMAEVLSIDGVDKFVFPDYSDRYPLDKLHYNPDLMDNSVGDIKSRMAISIATMGQDQRHRTIRRGQPNFTGEFYLPPVPLELDLAMAAVDLMLDWVAVAKRVPATLAMILAPYGAMVAYEKRGSFNAVDHEKGKRTCHCAQEEIYWEAVLERKSIEKKFGTNSSILNIFEPPCYRTGKCTEGDRYCGRDLKLRKTGDYFPRRRV